ncbi:MAG TPA: serine/threonine-protein kinase, partial [Kofleriaceae bacterium]|nr:serine/threonine-protein kinase [Kofleriaceae bacterium]
MSQRALPGSIGGCRVIARLGQGGMGETYRAVRTGAGGFEREVAIKVIRPDQADDPGLRERFLREGKLAGALHHRAVVQVFDAGVDGDEFYLVMEYLRGVDLRQLAREQGGRLPWRAALWIAAEAARGLEAAHDLRGPGAEAGIIHRDVSPSNIMTCADGAVKVLDFGLARPVGGERSSSRLSGKLPYVAPESANGGEIDARVDLYALGVTLYWLMTGVQPFEGRNELDTIQRILIGRVDPPSALVAG